MRSIPHSRPTLGDEEARAVSRVILSSHPAQGPVVEAFERAMADYIGVRYGVAVSSGTAALHLALLALGIKEGDEVIIPDYTCTALLNAVLYTGATPVAVDVLPREYAMDPSEVKKALSRKTKAVILVHPFGLPAPVEEILSFGLPVIEDLAQAVGASFHGVMAGRSGHISVVSFYATKMLTTGEGGMVLTSSSEIVEKVRDLRDYDNREDHRVRFNYKMTDMGAAMGLVQLKRLPEFIEKRREIALYYNRAFSNLPLELPIFEAERGHVYYRYVVEVEGKAAPFLKALKDRGVEARRPVFKPIHAYIGGGDCRVSEMAWERSISLPIYPSLSKEEMERVAGAVREVFGQ